MKNDLNSMTVAARGIAPHSIRDRRPSQGRDVVIVEDEILVALELEEILEDAGYNILAVISDRNGLTGLSQGPDIAFVDVNLRDGRTGPGIARELSDRYGTSIIYVTANPGQIDSYADTTRAVVQKPWTSRAILEALRDE